MSVAYVSRVRLFAPANTQIQVLDTPEPLRNLSELIAAQMQFYKQAYEILAELAPEVDALQEEQEVCFTPFCVAKLSNPSIEWIP